MAISIALSRSSTASTAGAKKDSTTTTDPSNNKRSAPAAKSSVFGADSDSEPSPPGSPGTHLLSKRPKKSHNAGPGAHSTTATTSVAAERTSVRVKYKDYDLSTDNLPPELYLYDELEDQKDGAERDDPRSLLYLGAAPSKPAVQSAAPAAKDSQYMPSLLRTARDRRMERDIAFDKQQLKADLDGGDAVGEVFVTGAYKRQLEERRRFEEEQRRKDAADLLSSGKSVASLHAHMLKSGLASRSNRRS
ncbi:nuclear speckle splicing regulatory protein 1 [Babesia caballi]|uniref:Nuclear speckle splicing regulatory protein 1 n=1 Tax=Babesia caballi TaxID=5871 RepID=A0AAV4LLA5_BABCB|nr:nuclear speckle splicing regulatory protein 1 [Babesia caballi]